MYKNIFSLIIVTLFIPTMALVGMTPDTSVPNPLQTAKAKVELALKKNKAKLQTFKKNEKLAPAIAKIETLLNKVVTSTEFKSVIEAMTTKQAEDIAQGKTLEEVDYNHSLSNEFPKMTNVNKLLALIYSLMANVAHYQLLQEKLNNIKETQLTQAPVTTYDTTKETTET